MLVNKGDLNPTEKYLFTIRFFCDKCGEEIDGWLSHMGTNQIMIDQHRCPTVSKPDSKGVSE